ncbi:hypothetical protein [Cecembia calidifontis]|uniref:Antitoxin component YwqK of YwqJK toxin-antitoxin module n=1 Tax=Cecembia calidifontis TaxID=1187080 RepID=A0A4Q7PCE2_9BACT|nr:hypothetical protein [Cecembia calidifontis]RZS97250.1 hypothetical protein BC751_2853 [Cecembia calidifontis]
MDLKFHLARFSLILLVAMISLSVHGQQVYEGEYTFNGLKGESVFQFVKGEGDAVIRQGEFKFNRREKDREDRTRIYKTLVDGFYEQDKKTGLWNYLDEKHYIELNDVNNFRLDYNISSEQIKLRAAYKNGVPDGRWTFEENEYRSGRLSPKSQADNFLFREGDIVGKFQYKSFVNNRTHFIRGELNRNGFMNGEWTFVYREGDQLVSEIRNYENGFLLGIVKRNLESDEILEEVVYYQTIKKLNQVNNRENKGFRIAEDRFGLVFSDGFLTDSEQFKVQLSGNKFITEFLTNILRYDAQYVNQEGELIDYPIHTKKFVFELSRQEQRIVEDLPAEFDRLQNTVKNYAERNSLRLNRQKSDTLAFAFSFFQFQSEKVSKFSELIDLFRTKDIQYYDLGHLVEEGMSFLLEKDVIRYEIGDSIRIREIDFRMGDFQGNFYTALSDYIKQMSDRTLEVKALVDGELSKIERDEDLRIIQNQIQERKDKIEAIYLREEGLDERERELIASIRSNILNTEFGRLNERFAKEEDFNIKKDQAKIMLDLLEEMEDRYPAFLDLFKKADRMDQLYMEEIFNPFTYTRYDQRAKARLYESAEKLMEYYLDGLAKEQNYIELKTWLNKIDKLLERMGALREADTRRLERKIHRRLSVGKIESLLEL